MGRNFLVRRSLSRRISGNGINIEQEDSENSSNENNSTYDRHIVSPAENLTDENSGK